MGRLRLRRRLLFPGVYVAIAVAAWLDFLRLPPDGLANVGLMLVALPASLLDLLLQAVLGSSRSVLIPSSLGYYAAHALFFWVSVPIIAGGLSLAGRRFDRPRADAV